MSTWNTPSDGKIKNVNVNVNFNKKKEEDGPGASTATLVAAAPTLAAAITDAIKQVRADS